MFTKLITLSALFISAYCLSIGAVSEHNVTKRKASSGDLFPDWVPFKNKHGDELGEFVQVEKKSKLKKRLAPPLNFLLRAVAEPEGDDYDDKSAGESDSDDYFEKKDWSDLHRPADDVDKKQVTLNHTDISDIDGVVQIITDRPPSPILDAIKNNARYLKKEENKIDPPENIEKDQDEMDESIETTTAAKAQSTTEAQKEKQRNVNDEEDSNDYDEPPKKTKPEEDKENEARKAEILSSVDELKERHAEEQRELSQKLKGENLYENEFGRDKSFRKTHNRFTADSSEDTTKISRNSRRKTTVKPDYDEYEDLSNSSEDKYKINVIKQTTVPQTEAPRLIKIPTTTDERKKVKHTESGKLSVFKNPQLYIIYDDEETTVSPVTSASVVGQQKFSSRYTTTPPNSSHERISLVPVSSKEGEPTLFFPKPRKNKRKRIRMTTTTPAIDSTVAETVTDNYKQTTDFSQDTTAPFAPSTLSFTDSTSSDTTAAGTTGTRITTGSEPTGTDTEATNANTVTDAVSASSDHKKEQSADYDKETGGSREHHSEHSEEHEEHGKKAYEGHHEDSKAAKGYHDKENHLGKYDDRGGVDKHHSEESGHYGDHHHEEHGKKHAKYEESGKHSKGHSTKGSHDIHKKEEYEKNVEFFEEEGDSADDEKHGGYNHEKEHSEGGRFKKGNHEAGHKDHSKGEFGHFSKGGHHEMHKGHKLANGHDSHGKHGGKRYQKAGNDEGKKWIYHQGHPAKTANLVVIDRRGGQYYHGPHYYG